jgi:CubicO group peptidase (beta-lactamase class C family)
MKIATLMAAAAALTFSTTAQAQSAQEQLDARYDRALAAGYKALMLCSAIGNAEANGVTRSIDSVVRLELTGIQAPLDSIVPTLEPEIYRTQNGTGALSRVEVAWAEDMPPRIAWHREEGGCSLAPVGLEAPPRPEQLRRSYPNAIVADSTRIIPATLEPNFSAAFDGTYGEGSRTTAVMIAGPRGDGYWRFAKDIGPATPQRTWSVAKSIAATLVGAAVQRGEVNVNDSAGLGAGAGDPRNAITIDNALRMASGRYSDTPGNRTDPLYWGGATVDERAKNWPLIHTPNTVYRYANNDTLAAVQAIKPSFELHPPAEFFAKLGMKNTVAETDWQGNYVLSSQVWSTAPDLLRLGQLYLNDGVLPSGERILPKGWVEYVSAPAGPQPGRANGWGYGAGWWLLNDHEGVPADTFLAAGNRGQYIVVIPSRDVVIVRRGEDMVGTSFDIVAFTRDVLAVLEE